MPGPPPTPKRVNRIQRLWRIAVEPAPTLKDPLARHRVRLLNSLLAIFMPLAVIVLGIQMIILPIQDIWQSNTIKALIMGIAMVALIYIFNRAGYYRFTTYLALTLGFIAIITNAIVSDPPHFEIAYLVMLPLLGTLLLSFRETVFLAILIFICQIAFTIVFRHEISPDIIKDLLIFTVFIEAFILFVSHHRNRLEADRQQLVIERERNDLLQQLIANLSHEYRTPLTIIRTSLYLLVRITDPQKQQEKYDQIELAITRLNKLMDDIIAITRLDYVRDESLESVNINALIQQVVATLRPEIEPKTLEIQFDLDTALPPLLANKDDLERALTILIENAVQYTDSGMIALRTYQARQTLVIEIHDTGIGITEDELPHIFERFYKGHSGISKHGGGTGIGLAIVKRIVELHHGQIEVESVVGKGSLFRVSLPLTDTE